MGFQVANDGTITYREWAPAAHAAYLIGDFSGSHSTMTSLLLYVLNRLTLLLCFFFRRLEQRISSYAEIAIWCIRDNLATKRWTTCDTS